MIVDTSAFIAILRGEPDADRYVDALARAAEPLVSAGTYVETAIVVDASRDPVLSGRLDDLLGVTGVKVEPLTKRHADIARRAYRDFGGEAATRLDSTSATASPTRCPGQPASRCCTRATTSAAQTSWPRCSHERITQLRSVHHARTRPYDQAHESPLTIHPLVLGEGQRPVWRWRESNPRPPSLRQDFSGRSVRCLYSAPPVMHTGRCDGSSRCWLSSSIPRPDRRVSHLADASDRAGDEPGLTESSRLGSESELGATIVGAYFVCVA